MRQRRLILVTGAPRTGTTPVGNLLAHCEAAVSLYEPLGPTGVTRITEPYPMVGAGLGIEQTELPQLLDDLRTLRLGKLKSQVREGHRPGLKAAVLGSRTLHSLRLARMHPWAGTIVWKDPHAIMLVPDLVEAGLDVVVTVRTPWAHAASYKRLGWISKAAQIYPRWSARYGPCGTCEEFMNQAGDRVVSAALLWRLSYLPLIRTSAIRSVRLVTSEALERDERSTYLELIRALGLTPTARVERALSQVRRDTASSQMTRKTHDWSRSITSLNTYWKEVLTAEDLEKIQALTSDMLPYLFPSGAGSAAAVEISSGFDPDRHNFPKDLESSG